MSSINSKKKQMRRLARRRLSALSVDDVKVKSRIIARRLLASGLWRRCRTVLAYWAMEGEARTDLIIGAALRRGKSVFLPRVEGEELVFRFFDGREEGLVRHPYGMLEPRVSSRIWMRDAAKEGQQDLIVVPGLAFDRRGRRLGRGKGFYDRFLACMFRGTGEGCTVVAVAFECQVFAAVPSDERDQRVDFVLTENGAWPDLPSA